MISGKRIHINGIVQGVGFRPFVYGLAADLSLTGWVRNTSAGVDIEVDGPPEQLDRFTAALAHDAPPLAQIDEITAADQPANGFTTFEIIHSQAVTGAFQPISPDVSICDDCLRELFDPLDHRYRYPFINCTNCGPRFTIIKDIPYDRPLTTMAPFEMCPDCRTEYENPLDRRFHAQPVACPECGPQVWLEISASNPQSPTSALHAEEAIQATRRLLAEGKIVAIKGLGGFHLACDAVNDTAVTELRRRKLRRDKPFALMLPDLAAIERHCYVNQAERDLLTSPQRPIVILRRRPDSSISTAVAPGQATIGVMLPYTPLHYLLFREEITPAAPTTNERKRSVGFQPASERDAHATFAEEGNIEEPLFSALVMTSGNLSEEPIAYRNEEARERLDQLADAFLMHDREIHVRCDDSVMRVFDVQPSVFSEESPIPRQTQDRVSTLHASIPLRRSRGYAPFPVRLPWEMPPILAAGAELKNTFCLTHGRYAFLSHHIGDLENYETLRSFEEGVAHFERLFRVRPELLAYDLHPDYLATRYALARAEREGVTAVPVQHHHAHIAACMAEHSLPNEPVIGVSFDGTGYGTDGRIWGGEILLADYAGFERPYHLTYIPLLGGDTAVRQPWRLALAWLRQAGLDWADDLPPVQAAPPQALPVLQRMIATQTGVSLTSSMGRLFDAAAALAGVRQTINYEAQAAIELEALVEPQETGAYPFALSEDTIDAAPLIQAVVADVRAGVPAGIIAARFHNGVAQMVLDVCRLLYGRTGLKTIVLSGGVWQNETLLTRVIPLLQTNHFTVYWHQKVPPNDGGLALGQAVIAGMHYQD